MILAPGPGYADAHTDKPTDKIIGSRCKGTSYNHYPEGLCNLDMTAPQDYTPMPWVRRFALPIKTPSNSSDDTDSDDDVPIEYTPTTQSNIVLIRQLQDSHTDRLALRRRTTDLEKELSMMRKSAQVPNEVGLCAYNMVQEASLRAKENEEERERMDKGWKELESDKAQLKEWKEREISKAVFEARMETMREMEKKEAAQKEKEQKERAELEAAMKKEIENLTSTPGDTRIKRTVDCYTISGTDGLFEIENTRKFDTHDFPISANIMNGPDIELLRHHDYYRGWYDCSTITQEKALARRSKKPKSDFPHLFSPSAILNPEVVGADAGALFTHAALCKKYDKSEWNTRLDDEEWNMSELNSNCRKGGDDSDGSGFWSGFARGKKAMKKKFKELLQEQE